MSEQQARALAEKLHDAIEGTDAEIAGASLANVLASVLSTYQPNQRELIMGQLFGGIASHLGVEFAHVLGVFAIGHPLTPLPVDQVVLRLVEAAQTLVDTVGEPRDKELLKGKLLELAAVNPGVLH